MRCFVVMTLNASLSFTKTKTKKKTRGMLFVLLKAGI